MKSYFTQESGGLFAKTIYLPTDCLQKQSLSKRIVSKTSFVNPFLLSFVRRKQRGASLDILPVCYAGFATLESIGLLDMVDEGGGVGPNYDSRIIITMQLWNHQIPMCYHF